MRGGFRAHFAAISEEVRKRVEGARSTTDRITKKRRTSDEDGEPSQANNDGEGAPNGTNVDPYHDNFQQFATEATEKAIAAATAAAARTKNTGKSDPGKKRG